MRPPITMQEFHGGGEIAPLDPLVCVTISNDTETTYWAQVRRLSDGRILDAQAEQNLSALPGYLAALQATYGANRILLLTRVEPPGVLLRRPIPGGGGDGGAGSPADPNPKGFVSFGEPVELVAGGDPHAFSLFETNSESPTQITNVHFLVQIVHDSNSSGFKLVVPSSSTGYVAHDNHDGEDPPLLAGDEVESMYLRGPDEPSRILGVNDLATLALEVRATAAATGTARVRFELHCEEYLAVPCESPELSVS